MRECFTDGKKKVRFVGFNSDQRERIEELKSKSVELSDCAVKKQKYSDPLEIVVSDKTDIAECAKVITVDADFVSRKTIIMEQIGILNAGEEVQLVGKVCCVGATTVIDNGSQLQEVVVADKTGKCNLTLWAGDVGSLNEDQSYKYSNLKVKRFCNANTLVFGRNSSAVKMDDIGETVPFTKAVCEEHVLDYCEVIGVQCFELVLICISCKGKTQQLEDSLVKCDSCGILQRMENCTLSVYAKLRIRSNKSVVATVSGRGEMLAQICCCNLSDVTSQLLCKSSGFRVVYNDKNVLLDV